EDSMQLADEARKALAVALERLVADEITTGRERTPRTGHEHPSHRPVALDLVECGVERVEHGPVDGVELVGPVEHQGHAHVFGVGERRTAGGHRAGFGLGHAHPLSMLRSGALAPRFVARRDTRLAATSLMLPRSRGDGGSRASGSCPTRWSAARSTARVAAG